MSTELRPRDLENASGAEMPFMLEGALKALFQIPKTKRTTGATDGPKLPHRTEAWSELDRAFFETP